MPSINSRQVFWAIVISAVAVGGGFQFVISQTRPFELDPYLQQAHKRGHFISLSEELQAKVRERGLLLNPQPVARPDDGVMRAYVVDTDGIAKDWMIPYSWRQYTRAHFVDSGEAFFCWRTLIVDGSILSRSYSSESPFKAGNGASVSLPALGVGSGKIDRETAFLLILLHESVHLEDFRYEAQIAIGESARTRYEEGMHLMTSNNWPNAERAFRSAIVSCPAFVAALDQLAISVRRQDRLEEAIGLYRKSLKIDPGGVIARQNLIGVLAQADRLAEAQDEAKTLVARAPDNAEGPFWLGVIAVNEKKLPEALDYLDTASRLYRQSNNPLAIQADAMRVQVARTLNLSARLANASRDLKESCERFPGSCKPSAGERVP